MFGFLDEIFGILNSLFFEFLPKFFEFLSNFLNFNLQIFGLLSKFCLNFFQSFLEYLTFKIHLVVCPGHLHSCVGHKGVNTEVKKPEGPPYGSQGLEGPQTSSN